MVVGRPTKRGTKVGETETVNGTTWTWDGEEWGSPVIVSGPLERIAHDDVTRRRGGIR